MDLKDVSLQELLSLAAVEAEGDKLLDLIREINERYKEQERELAFDIFSGVPDRDAVWMERAVGLSAANNRMQQIAGNSPGAYFVFHPATGKVSARIDSSLKADAASKKSSKSA